MPLLRSMGLLSGSLLCTVLAAQDPAPKPPEKPSESAAAADGEKKERGCCHGWRHHRHGHPHAVFGAYVQGLMPVRDLKEDLDGRTGFGLGVQWIHDHGDWHASRTRLEWNTFAESRSAAGVRTYAKNYILSWDHLFKANKGEHQAYLVVGIGGARWYHEQTGAGFRDSRWTTKPAITGGAGVSFARRMNLEARYVVSSLDRTFDANTLQASLGWRF